jgi:hypothetical protein
LILDDVGMFELLEDGDFAADFLFGYELTVHFFDGDLLAGVDVPALVDLAEGTLTNTVLFCEEVVPHLNLDLLIHR